MLGNPCLLDDVLQAVLHADINLLGGFVPEAHIVHLGVAGKGQVGWQSPWSSCPGDQVGIKLIFEGGEHDNNGGVIDVLIVGTGLRVRQHGVAGSGEGHDLGASVDKAALEDLLEGPPDTLHILGVHGLVIVLEVDPATEPLHDGLPLFGKPHNNLSAELVVLLDTEGFSLDRRGDLVDLVNLELNGESVAIPAESTLDIVTLHGGISSYDILNNKISDAPKYLP